MMKKVVNIVIGIAVIGTIALCSYIIGHEAGVYHAIAKSKVYLPNRFIEIVKDEGFAIDKACQVQIVLDNNIYVHSAIMSN